MGQLDETRFDAVVRAGCPACGGTTLDIRSFLDRRLLMMLGDPNDDGRWVHDGEKFVDGTYRIVCAGSDGKFEKAYEKMKAEAPKQQLSPDATYDIVYQDNSFRVVPEGFEKAFTMHEMKRVVPFQ